MRGRGRWSRPGSPRDGQGLAQKEPPACRVQGEASERSIVGSRAGSKGQLCMCPHGAPCWTARSKPSLKQLSSLTANERHSQGVSTYWAVLHIPTVPSKALLTIVQMRCSPGGERQPEATLSGRAEPGTAHGSCLQAGSFCQELKVKGKLPRTRLPRCAQEMGPVPKHRAGSSSSWTRDRQDDN